MKTILDFLMENGDFLCYIGNLEVSFTPHFGCITMCVNGKKSHNIEAENPYGFQDIIQDILYEKYKTEIRFCEECGKPYDKGFVAGDGDWYCCEDCFEDAMNKTYGKDKWRGTEEEGCNGGYYESFDGNEWEDTGVFYTEWN